VENTAYRFLTDYINGQGQNPELYRRGRSLINSARRLHSISDVLNERLREARRLNAGTK